MHNSKIKYKHFSYARNLYGTVAQTKVRTEAEPQHMHTHPNKFIKQIVRTFFGELLGNWIGIQFRDGLCFVSILSENTSEIFGWIEMQLQNSSGKWEVKNACEVLDANACSGKFLQYESRFLTEKLFREGNFRNFLSSIHCSWYFLSLDWRLKDDKKIRSWLQLVKEFQFTSFKWMDDEIVVKMWNYNESLQTLGRVWNCMTSLNDGCTESQVN